MDKGELRAPFAGMVPFIFESSQSEIPRERLAAPGGAHQGMKNFTRLLVVTVLALGLSIASAATAPRDAGQTTGESFPVLRSLDSAAILTPSSSDDLYLIHPWDTPQRYDSTRSGGPASGLRPRFGERETEPTGDLDMRGAAKGGATKPTGIDDLKNYPNPFNAQTRIEFRLVSAGPVELSVFNLLGQSVRTMELGEMEGGSHSWTWDGMMEGGRPAPSGIYFYRVSSGAFSAMDKMVLLK